MTIKFANIFSKSTPKTINAAEFLAHCLTMSTDYVYRGQGDNNWKLVPSAFRSSTGGSVPVNKRIEIIGYFNSDKFKDDFIRLNKAGGHIEGLSLHKKNGFARLQMLVFFQHFGIPTPLLDWTDSPLVALFMAYTFRPQKSNVVRIFRLNDLHKPPGANLQKYDQIGFERIRRQLGGVTFCGSLHMDALNLDSTLETDLIKNSDPSYKNSIQFVDVSVNLTDKTLIDNALSSNGFTLENLFPNSPYWASKAIASSLPWIKK